MLHASGGAASSAVDPCVSGRGQAASALGAALVRWDRGMYDLPVRAWYRACAAAPRGQRDRYAGLAGVLGHSAALLPGWRHHNGYAPSLRCRCRMVLMSCYRPWAMSPTTCPLLVPAIGLSAI